MRVTGVGSSKFPGKKNHCYIFQVSEKIDAVLILIISVIH